MQLQRVRVRFKPNQSDSGEFTISHLLVDLNIVCLLELPWELLKKLLGQGCTQDQINKNRWQGFGISIFKAF